MVSRWEHRCPGCGKTVRWRKLFCMDCTNPNRAGLQLSTYQTVVAGRRLVGIPYSSAKILFRADSSLVCLCCGISDEQRHRCYFKNVRSGDKVRCFECRVKKSMASFPVIFISRRTRSSHWVKARSVLCNSCLAGKRVVLA